MAIYLHLDILLRLHGTMIILLQRDLLFAAYSSSEKNFQKSAKTTHI